MANSGVNVEVKVSAAGLYYLAKHPDRVGTFSTTNLNVGGDSTYNVHTFQIKENSTVSAILVLDPAGFDQQPVLYHTKNASLAPSIPDEWQQNNLIWRDEIDGGRDSSWGPKGASLAVFMANGGATVNLSLADTVVSTLPFKTPYTIEGRNKTVSGYGGGAITINVDDGGDTTGKDMTLTGSKLIKAGPGKLTLANVTNNTGLTNITGGTLSISSNAALSNGLITINDAALKVTANIAGLQANQNFGIGPQGATIIVANAGDAFVIDKSVSDVAVVSRAAAENGALINTGELNLRSPLRMLADAGNRAYINSLNSGRTLMVDTFVIEDGINIDYRIDKGSSFTFKNLQVAGYTTTA